MNETAASTYMEWGPDEVELRHIRRERAARERARMESIRQQAVREAGAHIPNAVWQWMHGRAYTLHGVSGIVKHEVRLAYYPTGRWVETLIHEPDAHGKQHPEYIALRERLGDDHYTDLTDTVIWTDIADELGVPDTIIDRYCADVAELLDGRA